MRRVAADDDGLVAAVAVELRGHVVEHAHGVGGAAAVGPPGREGRHAPAARRLQRREAEPRVRGQVERPVPLAAARAELVDVRAAPPLEEDDALRGPAEALVQPQQLRDLRRRREGVVGQEELHRRGPGPVEERAAQRLEDARDPELALEELRRVVLPAVGLGDGRAVAVGRRPPLDAVVEAHEAVDVAVLRALRERRLDRRVPKDDAHIPITRDRRFQGREVFAPERELADLRVDLDVELRRVRDGLDGSARVAARRRRVAAPVPRAGDAAPGRVGGRVAVAVDEGARDRRRRRERGRHDRVEARLVRGRGRGAEPPPRVLEQLVELELRHQNLAVVPPELVERVARRQK